MFSLVSLFLVASAMSQVSLALVRAPGGLAWHSCYSRLSRSSVARTAWRSLFGSGEEEPPDIDERLKKLFEAYAKGNENNLHIQREGLRDLLECTESFCLTKHWLADEFVDKVYATYAKEDGVGLSEFAQIARDGLLLQGKLEDYSKAFNGVDTSGSGLISREALGRLFAGLGREMSSEELDKIIDEADAGQDSIDLADFLRLARTHLELKQVLNYVATRTRPSDESALPIDLAGQPANGLTDITSVDTEEDLNAIVASGADAVCKLAFTWCKPCKAFWPIYQRFAQVYADTRFLVIVGNENESCKHYAREVLKAKISPMFAAYSGGKLVATWTGANNARFIAQMEEHLPTAAARAQAREEAVAADEAQLQNSQ